MPSHLVRQDVTVLQAVLSLGVLLQFLGQLVAATKNGFFAESMGTQFKILTLRCNAGMLTADNDVMSITIFNATSLNKLAWVSKGRAPSTGNLSMDKNVFLSGSLSVGHYHLANLRVLMIDYDSHLDQMFGCNVTVMSKETEIKIHTWTVVVNKTVSAATDSITTSSPYTEAPYRIGAVKEKEIDTGNLPMTVLIVMLVLISVLLFLAVFLLLHRYRSRCQSRDEELYRPPAYCLSPEHQLDWTGTSSTLKSKATLNSRSHYSMAGHHPIHMPLPPVPHLVHANLPRRGRTYRRPPSVGSSVKVPYVQPQDAIGQESSEDGEIAALNSSSPKVHYRSPTHRQNRQNSPLYACVPVNSTDD